MAIKRPGGGGGGYGPGPSAGASGRGGKNSGGGGRIGAGKGMGRFSGGSIRGDQSKLAKWEKDLLPQARRVAKDKKTYEQGRKRMVAEQRNASKTVGDKSAAVAKKPSGGNKSYSKTSIGSTKSVPLKPSGNKSVKAAAKKKMGKK